MALKMMRRKPETGLIAFAVLIILILTGCQDPFALEDLIDGPDGKPLTISPASAVLYSGNTLTIETSGGIPPYSYAVVSGTGTVSGNVYTAPPVTGTERIRVRDSAGNALEAVYTIDAEAIGLVISPSVQTIFSGQTIIFIAVGGTPPYNFAVTAAPSGSTTAPGTGTTYSYTAGSVSGVTDQVTLTDGTTSVTANIAVDPAPAVTNVDYEVTTLTDFSVPGYAETGTAMTGEFSVTNNGSAAGSAPLNWTIYASTDGTIGGNDFIVASGSRAGLGAGATVPSITANGTWPSVPGSYNLILYLASADDLSLVDNQDQFTGSVALYAPLTVLPSAVDAYVGQEVTFTPAGGSGTYTYAISTVGSEGVISPSFAGNIYTAGDIAGTDIVTVNDTVYPLLSENATVTVTVPPLSYAVDYSVGLPENLSSTFVNGTALSGDFTLDNIGSADGGYPVDWTVYASANTILGPNDFIIDSGSEGALSSGSGTTMSFSGFWPGSGTPYYLFVEIAALDDNTPGNDTSMGAANVLSPVAPADIEYTISNVSAPAVSVLTGSTLSESFDLTNGGIDAGAATVYWTAYLSSGNATLEIGSDIPIASGTNASLGAGASSTGITVSGYWPQTAGTWYLIVSENASDEITAGDIGVSAAVTVNDPAVDYKISNFTVPGTPALAGTPLSGSFQIESISPDTGTDTIYWTAYVSTDATITPGVDPVVDSGVITADLAGFALSAPQTISGSWPSSANSYLVLVKLYSGDDTNSLNDEGQSGPHIISLPDVEYEVSAITAGNTTPNAGSVIGESFTLQNSGADAGSSSLNWYVYLSDDATYDVGGDLLIESGSVTGVLAGDDGTPGSGADQTIITVTANWPETAGTRYLIVRENADDEGVADEWLASAAFAVQSVSLDVDYRVSTVPAGGSAQVGDPITDSFIMSNQGGDAGISAINWYVYRSANAAYDTGDILIDAGSYAGGLAGDDASPGGPDETTIAIDGDLVGGTWTAAGTYYLIVRLQASDETDTSNNFGVGGSYSITDPVAPTPDYVVSSISNEIPLVTAESAVSETFSVANVGGAGGVDISWTAYASTNTTLGGDTVIGSGIIAGGLAAGGTATDIAINGFWPSLSGDFYIIVEVDATDETNRNDTGTSADTVEVRLPPDYVIDSPDLDAIRYGGNPGELLSALGGGTPNFTIREANGQDGIYTVSWKILISADEYLDAGDTIVLAQGTLPALDAGTSSAPISFDDNLPPVPGMHYYIIQVSAPDDRDTGNNVLVTPPLYYWDPAAKTETTGITVDNSFGSADEFYLKFNSGDGISITGEIDEYAKRDMYIVRTGADPALTSIDVDLTWAAGYDDLDLYVYDENTDLHDLSNTTNINFEPVLNVAVVPNSTYYIEVYAYLNGNTAPAKNNSPGEPYSLIVTAP